MVDIIMSFKEILKKNNYLRIMGKTFNVLRAYVSDVHSFLKYYIESAERKEDYRFSILLLVHSIEKGMCMEPARPFGFEKTQNLIKMLVSYPEKRRKEFEYQMGVSILDRTTSGYNLQLSLFITGSYSFLPVPSSGFTHVFKNPFTIS